MGFLIVLVVFGLFFWLELLFVFLSVVVGFGGLYFYFFDVFGFRMVGEFYF